MTVKTSVYLDDRDKAALARLAQSSGTSEAELLRRGVRLVLEQAAAPRPHLALGASTDGRSAADSDDLLALHGFGE
ncbi:MAG: CopG family transcriptional regulator [Mycobacteriales bacterium]|nr:CopG family transcriptional regulator [Mycobacteriales bacterium]